MKNYILLFISTFCFSIGSNAQTYTVSTFAGNGVHGYADGTGNDALFNLPYGIAIDTNGNIFVCDYFNHKIRKITPSGVVTTFAGSTQGYADGTGVNAKFNLPHNLCIDISDNIYIADEGNHKIRKITPSGVVTTFAGSTLGFANGIGTSAKFNSPSCVAVDSSGNLYVTDTDNHKIRKITPSGLVTTIAGSTAGYADGIGTSAMFDEPIGIVIDNAGNLFISDLFNHKIRKISPTGIVTTFVGSTGGFADGSGSAAMFYFPRGLAIDSANNIYVADTGNQNIRKITASGLVSTIAGTIFGYLDGEGTVAQFKNPYCITVSNDGTLFIADTGNNRIRKITNTTLGTTNEIVTNNIIQIYPNPTTNFINISTKKKITSAEIYDINGRQLLKTNNVENKISVENLPNGMYLLKLQLENGATKTEKIIKN